VHAKGSRNASMIASIRLTNEDIIDLYNRAKIGATVVVQR